MFQILDAMYFFAEAGASFDPSVTFFPALYASEHVEAVILGHRSEYHFSLLFWSVVPSISLKQSGVRLAINLPTCCSNTDVSSRL